ncbi:hypothetical protein [Thalassotalea euphylliae]|nr:hypothetical protein [Thalassotalea euphylliae]
MQGWESTPEQPPQVISDRAIEKQKQQDQEYKDLLQRIDLMKNIK